MKVEQAGVASTSFPYLPDSLPKCVVAHLLSHTDLTLPTTSFKSIATCLDRRIELHFFVDAIDRIYSCAVTAVTPESLEKAL